MSPTNLAANMSLGAFGFNVPELRTAFQVQRFLELLARTGTLRSPTTSSATVSGGANYEITFNGNPDYTFSSMTVNGVEVTPIIKSAPAPTLPTYTVSTNYGTY